METLELKSMGLQELDPRELEINNGGWLKEALFVIAVALISDWDNFKAGLAGNCES